MALISVGGYEEDIQQLKSDITELQSSISTLNTEIKKRIGTIFYTADSSKYPDALICDGSELNVSEYEDLWNVIGYLYGGSDDVFKTPNLINRVPWGSVNSPGYLSAGLPNITGRCGHDGLIGGSVSVNTANSAIQILNRSENTAVKTSSVTTTTQRTFIYIDASLSNSIYGNSDTVQPPACKLTPMIWFK